MAESIDPKYVQEVECLTSCLIRGDITPLVFNVLKHTTDLDGLLRHLGCSATEVNVTDVSKPDDVCKPDFTKLFNNSEPV